MHLTEKQTNNFWNKVQKTEDCWNWIGSKVRGYGQFGTLIGKQLAHRITYQLFNADIPKERLVLHHCDNPSCVNPEHLFLGTPQDNMTDMVKKDRAAKGPAKINKEIANQIRSSNLSCRKLAALYHIGPSQVNRIKRGLHWL